MEPGTHVLVVDDDALVRAATVRALERAGLAVLGAPSAEIALEILATATIDAILSDLALPKVTGLELLTRARDDPRWARIALVLWTGSGPLAPDAVRALDELGIEYLEKPAKTEVLLAALDRALARARARSASL